MRLSTELTVGMVALVAATAGAVGFFTYRSVEAAIVPGLFDQVSHHARELGSDLQSFVRGAQLDVLSFRDTVLVRGIVDDPSNGAFERGYRSIFALRLVSELKNKPEYYRFRLIGVADGGREIVRVDRSGPAGAIRIVPDQMLQREGERGFFQAAIRLPLNEVYVSPIELSRDKDGIENPHVPILETATPVYAADGRVQAILVITLDMRPAFERLRVWKQDGGQIYLINASGDYLVHPDRSREFAFEFGMPVRAQADFPAFNERIGAEDFASDETHEVVGDRIGAVIAPRRIPHGPLVAIIETVPYSLLRIPAIAVGRSGLVVAVAAILIAAGFALGLARTVTRPLAQLTAATEKFAADQPIVVPTDAAGEIGTLARAFERMTIDVRDKTATIARLGERERLYIAVVESSEDAIHVRSKDGAISAWNPASERIFGYTAEEAIGQSIDIMIPPERRAEPLAVLDRFAKGERMATFESIRKRKNGEYFDALVTVSPLKAASGELIGTATAIRDLSAQKRVEERYRTELRDAQAELSRVMRLTTVGEMAASIAHEVNQPLAAVIANGAAASRWLANRPPNLKEAREALNQGVREANRASEIIKRIRSLLKREKSDYVALDITGAIDEVIAFTIGERRAHRVVVETELDRGLPRVRGDRIQLQQVVLNLMLNGIEAMSDVTDRQRVLNLHTYADAGQVVVAIEDSGDGLDSEAAERVFEPFFTTKPNGLGMGLAIARSIIEAHGGRLWVSPGPVHGTIFTFTVPYAAADVS